LNSSREHYILIAEDDPTNQFIFRKILERAGYRVMVVDDGKKALEACRIQRPDLILMDIMMPVMSGFEAASLMMQDPALDGVPILALTARVMPGDYQKSKEAGCDDFISKPVRLDDLLAKIKEWTSKDPDTWMPLRLSRRKPPHTAAG
jgi:CheY-like chemotaxis protein